MTEPQINGQYIEAKLAEQDRLRQAAERRLEDICEHLDTAHRSLVDEKFASIRVENAAVSEALRLQHEEYKRRLHDLNGEAQRLRDIQATYVPRESYESYVKEAEAKAAALLARVDETREALEKATGETTKRLEQQIKELSGESRQRLGGETAAEKARTTASDLWARTVAAAAVLIALAGLIVLLARTP